MTTPSTMEDTPKDEREAMKELAELREYKERASWFLNSKGYRRCEIDACNCPYWHGGKLEDRLNEIQEALQEAGVPWQGTILKTLEHAIAWQKTQAPSPTAWKEEALTRIFKEQIDNPQSYVGGGWNAGLERAVEIIKELGGDNGNI